MNVYFQLFCSFKVIVSFSTLSANSFTVMLSLLIPSWLFSSSHTFSTFISPFSFTNSGVWLFVTTNPFAWSPVVTASYPSGTSTSAIV